MLGCRITGRLGEPEVVNSMGPRAPSSIALAVVALMAVSSNAIFINRMPRIATNLGVLTPEVIEVGRGWSTPLRTGQCEARFHIACYQPDQLQVAYDLPALFRTGIDGRNETIIVVDPFGSPTISSDLGVFDEVSKLPAPPSFKVIEPAGLVPSYVGRGLRLTWAAETSLDVEYAHVMAPGAGIILVETPAAEIEGTSGFAQIVEAERYVIKHRLGEVISQSFGATENTFATKKSLLSLRTAYVAAARARITVVASVGDNGATNLRTDAATLYSYRVTSWPGSDPLVTGVGGSQLHLNARGLRTARDNVWNDTYSVATNKFIVGDNGPNPLAGGGGKSVIFARPSYQSSVRAVVGGERGVPDVSMSAACNGAVEVYQSFGGEKAGWYPECGTSEAAPLFAGVVALADQYAGHALGVLNPALYHLAALRAPGIVDIISGNNSVSFTQGGRLQKVTGFDAHRGYDLASGIGTVNAFLLVHELAKLVG